MLHRSLSDLDRLEHTRYCHSTENKLEHWKKLEKQVDCLIQDIEAMSSSHQRHTIGHFPIHHHASRSFSPLLTPDDHHLPPHSHLHIDLVTTLRSELAALTYKRDRLVNEVQEAKHTINAKDNECENLRAQIARQTAMISSLQDRLNASEMREKQLQAKCETNHHTFHREKKSFEERFRDMDTKIKRMEHDIHCEKTRTDDAKRNLADLVRKLSHCMGINHPDHHDHHESQHLTPDHVISKASEIVAELHRLRAKLSQTCDSLTNCENDFLTLKSQASSEKSKLLAQIETLQAHNEGINSRCRALEKDLHITKDRLTESEVTGEKLRDELRGLESRCSRIQANMDRLQGDRLQFLRQVSSIINVPEPCETLIKDKLREMENHTQVLHTQLCAVRDQLANETAKHKEFHEAASHKMKAEETHRITAEEHVEKLHHENNVLKAEHFTLSEYLVRLARALQWSECSSAPLPGNDTTILAETLLERADRLASFYDAHGHGDCKHSWEHVHSAPHHAHHLPKLRRERSCHDLPLKESVNMYALQKRVRILREQVQRRDLHLELLRRKLALVEDGARGKAILQTERDEALHRARKNSRQAERTAAQLIDVKTQLAEVKAQLAEAADYKITALERARKIDDLQSHIQHIEAEKARLQADLARCKTRARSVSESSAEKRVRDEATIATLREEIAALKRELEQVNHKLSHLQTFRHSVFRLLHLRDLPDATIVHRLHSLINAHEEYSSTSKCYDEPSTPPLPEETLPPVLNSGHNHRASSLSPVRRYPDHYLDHHYEDDFKF